MSRKLAPKELSELYDERIALRVTIALLEEHERDAVTLAQTRSELASVDRKISDAERIRRGA